MRPALISRSASLPIASISSGVGHIGVGGGDDRHEAHGKTPVEASRGAKRRETVSLWEYDEPAGGGSTGALENISAKRRRSSAGCRPARTLRARRIMIRGSALSGTRRHCALSSASNCQVSPLADIRIIWPRSSRHWFGANAATAGSHFGFRNTWKLSPVGLGVGQRQAADRHALAAHHRPVADHLVHRFGERAGGGEVLQDVDALARSAGPRKCRSRPR